MKLRVIGMGLLIMLSSLASAQDRIIKPNYVGCLTREDLSRFVSMAIDKDTKAMMAMVLQGRCHMLPAGSKASLEDTAIFSGMIKIRPQGSTEAYWAPIEATTR